MPQVPFPMHCEVPEHSLLGSPHEMFEQIPLPESFTAPEHDLHSPVQAVLQQ